ncbi:hypothetical protein KC19_1G105800 [Ceratodon purpureus]|uniref:Secreted protein n=1 Tax=Ceratodon purpureus TaxID=3225 RepID=A0A8T0J5L5_CERPU|nr:hypothetical protein KC19_1G105800 [Ceratodon purpureus]
MAMKGCGVLLFFVIFSFLAVEGEGGLEEDLRGVIEELCHVCALREEPRFVLIFTGR